MFIALSKQTNTHIQHRAQHKWKSIKRSLVRKREGARAHTGHTKFLVLVETVSQSASTSLSGAKWKMLPCVTLSLSISIFHSGSSVVLPACCCRYRCRIISFFFFFFYHQNNNIYTNTESEIEKKRTNNSKSVLWFLSKWQSRPRASAFSVFFLRCFLQTLTSMICACYCVVDIFNCCFICFELVSLFHFFTCCVCVCVYGFFIVLSSSSSRFSQMFARCCFFSSSLVAVVFIFLVQKLWERKRAHAATLHTRYMD